MPRELPADRVDLREFPGTTFHTVGYEPISDVVHSLHRVLAFLQEHDSYESLTRWKDFWQHDGRLFSSADTDFHEVFALIESPETLMGAMGDDAELIGVLPASRTWYLRMLSQWSHDGWRLEGYFDVTLPQALAGAFRADVVPAQSVPIVEEDARSYFLRLRAG